jgi:hypothetical protein
MSKLNINYNGIMLTLFGLSMSLSAGILSFGFLPRISTGICSFTSPVEPFVDELQWAKSVNKNDDCKANIDPEFKSQADNLQLMLSSMLFFGMYIQILRSLILASYLYQKHQDNKDKKFYVIEDAEQMYSGLLSNLYPDETKPKFDNLEALKASHLAQTFAVNAFINSMPLRERGENKSDDQTGISNKE